MKSIFKSVQDAGGLCIVIDKMKAEADIEKMRRPSRPSQPLDTVLGAATDEIKRLVHVHRQVKAWAVPFENIVEPVTRKLSAILEKAQGDRKGIAPIFELLREPGLEDAVKARDEAIPELAMLKAIRAHVKNQITIEIRCVFNVHGDTQIAIDKDWNIVTPAKRIPGTEGLPPEVSAIIRRLAAERGADSVQVVDVSSDGDISEILSRMRRTVN